MKARPVRKDGDSYHYCDPVVATHVYFQLPRPNGRVQIPVQIHGIREGTGNWTWNGNVDRPTFRPSLLIEGVEPVTEAEADSILAGAKIEPRPFRCHTWINDGHAQFLDDCTHELRGQTVGLKDWDAP